MGKKYLLLVLAGFLLGGYTASGQTHGTSSESPASANARFVIVQSTDSLRYVFKLDRYSGNIWQAVYDEDGKTVWQEMAIIDLPKPAQPAVPRYQMSLTALGMRNVFLIDNLSGMTWMLLQIVGDRVSNGEAWVPVRTTKEPFPSASFGDLKVGAKPKP